MPSEEDIWNRRGSLSRAHAGRGGSVELPPLPDDVAAPQPLRDVLQEFVSASPADREQYSLILENGQTFAADDIAELLERPDSPFR